ncbi:ABC transporter substrate-binding protein [Halorarum halobium]|uniref:ABC transporter substrate-binding protein n=1 Tax=Halorarum halobium TaxID=3075121 RepID=UPI0028AA1AAB|nr:ABC transporter substrate-binding protein [Halobaculum sp. XH14]
MTPALPVATRRRTLAALAATAGTAATGGCLDRIRSVAGRDSSDRVAVDIKAAPADADPVGIQIARTLAENLRTVGVGARVTPVAVEELHRQVLINNEFDLYVGRYPASTLIDPDELYPMIHSKFTSEPGWQNPFGCTDLALDELLDRQRMTSGQRRRDAVMELQRTIAEILPFSTLAFPDELSAVRLGEYEGWLGATDGFDTPLGLLGLDRTATDGTDPAGDDGAGPGGQGGTATPVTTPDGSGAEPTRLGLATTDGRITENRNPVAAEFRDTGTFTGLLYDPLARQYAGAVRPWLASEWTWDGGVSDDTDRAGGAGTDRGDEAETGTAAAAGTDTRTEAPVGEGTTDADEIDPTVATVRLREGLTWHDGEPITADDVAFTYAFLADTSMGGLDSPVPAPRFRGRSSLVDSVTATGPLTAELRFTVPSRTVAARALTVPLLPQHIWTERTGEVDVPGFGTDGVTEALVWMNPEPVGSGPLSFERASGGESALFTRFSDHFLARERPPADVPERFHGKPAFDELLVQRAPSDSTAVELAAAGDVDATVSQLDPATVPRIGRSNALRLVSARSWSFYHLGFNMRRSPLTNPHFRQAVAGLLDAGAVAAEQLGGYARPAATPLAGTEWEAPDLRWDAETRKAGFHGEDGQLDETAARRAFREAGYRYDEEGRLRS